MLKKSKNYILVAIAGGCFSACSPDSVEDEKFEAPTLDFPLLGDIPKRPQLPDPSMVSAQQQRLQADHDQTIVKEAEVLKSVRE
jgi:hypothetical protein